MLKCCAEPDTLAIEYSVNLRIQDSTPKVKEMAREIMETGMKYKDACHVASAIIAGCDYLISTDKRLLKYKNDKIKLVNPI